MGLQLQSSIEESEQAIVAAGKHWDEVTIVHRGIWTTPQYATGTSWHPLQSSIEESELTDRELLELIAARYNRP